MRGYPADWDSYSQNQRDTWWRKDRQVRNEIIVESYFSMITDENGTIDVHKLVEVILNLEDRIEELECKLSQE
jgi:hypothetical protein